MSHLLSLLQGGLPFFRPPPPPPEYKKIAILGIDAAGKRTLLHLVSDSTSLEEVAKSPSLQGCYGATVYCGSNKKLRLTFVAADAGCDEPPAMRAFRASKCCPDADAVIWMIDSADQERIEEAREWLEMYARGHMLRSGYGEVKMREGVPWVVLANKNDLKVCSITELRVVEDRR
jgi:signal recognition particle receptor subunit beta